MAYKYYSVSEFEKIHNLVFDYYFEQAIYAYQQYLKKYPNDYCVRSYYADSFIKIGKFEEASEVLDSVVFNSGIKEKALEILNLIKIKLLSCCGRYEEALELFKENIEVFDRRNWNTTETLIFLKKKCGKLLDIDYSGYSYAVDQITHYDENLVIERLKKYQEDSDIIKNYTFTKDFLVEETFSKLREMLPLEKRIYNTIVENVYIFRYDNCGIVDGKSVNYLKVTTLHDSNEILTIYPFDNKARIEGIDLTPKFDDEVKVKRLSQIEKFNKKYNIN